MYIIESIEKNTRICTWAAK